MTAIRRQRADVLPIRFARGVNLEPECEVFSLAGSFGKSLRPKHLSARATFTDDAAARDWLREWSVPTWVRCQPAPFVYVAADGRNRPIAILRLEIDLAGRTPAAYCSEVGRDRALRFLLALRASRHRIDWQTPAVPRVYRSIHAFEMSLERGPDVIDSAENPRQYKD